jgi:hypothetical protein
MIEIARAIDDWDVVIDDDSAGELADIVAIGMRGGVFKVLLVHCKYSSEIYIGARLKDLYEVCGQAIRSADWRLNPDSMIANLVRREQQRQKDHGYSGLIVGEDKDLLRLWDNVHLASQIEFTVAIAQPGLSISKAEDEHLKLLAAAATHVREAAFGHFLVYCSK